ncbi:glycosyltransferase family 4 protein [Blautia sp.]|uniref:glycosyltransferase family 4 protein n=1 Tax=Blautia sp. TaxID=1955243 RepID=UPI003AB8CB59
MRVMWTVFVTFPEVANKVKKKAEYACTWARALSEPLRKEVELAIVSVYSEKRLGKFEVNGVKYYFIPNEKKLKRTGGGKEAQKYWKEILDDFEPDIIHVHGSESPVPYELIALHPDIPIFLTLQGVLSNYYKDAYAGIEILDVIKNTTLRDVIRNSGIIGDRRKEKKRSKIEQEMLCNIRFVGGRTTWDKVSVFSINSKIHYFFSPEMIRSEFYDSTRWNVQNIRRHRIFMHQGFKPIKGLHILLEAMFILKKRYPDLELYMSGSNYMKNSTLKDKILQPGYIKYLFKKINEYKLTECIHFTGILNATQIIDELKKAHVMVLPSSIENSPNSLCEAQLVGIPCVASYVGGVPEMIENGENGFLYTFNEPLMLAEYISKIFESDELAEKFSEREYKKIREKQNQEFVLRKTLENYTKIIEEWKE